MKEKRVEYFRKALTIPLEKIRYDTLCVTRGGFEDVGELYSSEEEDLDSDSENDDCKWNIMLNKLFSEFSILV